MAIRRIWRYLLVEPFTWLFYCLYQPIRLNRYVDTYKGPSFKRFSQLLRVIPPVFLSILPFMLVGWSLFFSFFHYRIGNIAVAAADYGSLIFWLLIQTAIIILLVGTLLGLARGIALGLTVNIGYCIGLVFFHIENSFIYPLIVWGIIGGIVLGTIVGVFEDGLGTIIGNILLAGGLLIMVVLEAFLKDIPVIFLPQLSLYLLAFFGVNALSWLFWHLAGVSFATSITSKTLTWGLTYALYDTIIFSIVRPSTSGPLFQPINPLTIGVSLLVWGSFCLASYLAGSYRLLLYPLSAWSALQAYWMSRRHPDRIFLYLSRCSLHWDEYVFLPLPHLRALLLLAAEQDREGTRIAQEISFIRDDRLQQLGAVRVVCYELMLRSLETGTTFALIGQALHQLDRILLPEAIDPDGHRSFALFFNMRTHLDLYQTPIGQQQRGEALRQLTQNLQQALVQTAFRDRHLNERMQQVAARWQLLVEQERQQFNTTLQISGGINNPYSPGQVLNRENKLFVGRQDLVQRLTEALNRGQFHPPFLLHGEHRMGKSSLLRNLPRLLDSRYIPVFVDIQAGGMTANAASFLSTVARQIGEALRIRGLIVNKLAYQPLQEAARYNEATAYYLFDQWYRVVERLLTHEEWTVLLAFDEFEFLEQARQTGNLNVELLLGWLQSLYQNSPHFALLLSGAALLSELHPGWTKHFAGVQMLKVSFLRPVEARNLIELANAHQEHFPEEVVKELMVVSGCQPFLLQALCSCLIDLLNVEQRTRSELADLAEVVEQVLQMWGNYFEDLWKRCDELQQQCLLSWQTADAYSLTELIQQTGLDEATLQRALYGLQQRDLLTQHSGRYLAAQPLFVYWLKHRIPV